MGLSDVCQNITITFLLCNEMSHISKNKICQYCYAQLNKLDEHLEMFLNMKRKVQQCTLPQTEIPQTSQVFRCFTYAACQTLIQREKLLIANKIVSWRQNIKLYCKQTNKYYIQEKSQRFDNKQTTSVFTLESQLSCHFLLLSLEALTSFHFC